VRLSTPPAYGVSGRSKEMIRLCGGEAVPSTYLFGNTAFLALGIASGDVGAVGGGLLVEMGDDLEIEGKCVGRVGVTGRKRASV
jgi:hypothetical protein